MNNRQLIQKACGLVALAGVGQTEARADAQELDLCARALTQQLSLARVTPLDYRIDTESSTRDRGRSQRGVWHLDARHPETNEVVGRIDCVVDSREAVLRLTEVPLSASDAHIRANFD